MPIAALVPLAISAFQMANASSKEKKLKEEADELRANKPIKTTNQLDIDALKLAQSELASGMSAGAEQAYNDATDRTTSSLVSGLLKGGGDVNNIGEIYGASQVGRQNLAIMEDQLRLKQIDNVLRTYDKVSAEEEKNWLVNEWGEYRDDTAAIGVQRENAAQAKQDAFDSFGAAATTFVGGLADKAKLSLDKELESDAESSDNEAWGPNDQPFNEAGLGFGFTPVGETKDLVLKGFDYSTGQKVKEAPLKKWPNYLQPSPTDDAFANFWQTFKMKM